MSLVFWADQTNTVTNNALSVINRYSNVVTNALTITNNGAANAALTLPYPGTYMIEIHGWRCGQGSGATRVVATRGGSTVYDRRRFGAYADCSIFTAKYIWNGFLTGDVLTLYKNQNSSGAITPSISNSTVEDAWGPVIIYYLGLSNA
jgi:hypothetical protein